MKPWIWLVFAAVILSAIVFFASESADNQLGSSGTDNNLIVQSNSSNSSGSESNVSANLQNGYSAINNGPGGANSENKGGNIPNDINSVECGRYYSEYGICSGTCPSGTCVSEGRSCYCKKN